jgi:uncharacterized protein (DUF302 family)
MNNEPNNIVTKRSPWPVELSVARLAAIAAARDLQLYEVIDQSGEAAKAGMRLRDTKLLILGDAESGTPAIEANPLSALEIPLRVVVWADGHETKVSYAAPATLAHRYGLTDDIARRLGWIHAVTDALIDR